MDVPVFIPIIMGVVVILAAIAAKIVPNDELYKVMDGVLLSGIGLIYLTLCYGFNLVI